MAPARRAAHLRGDRAARRGSWARWASTTSASPAASRSCARSSGGWWRFSANPDVHDLSLTTNGYLLEAQVADLVAAGLERVNVSLDALAEDRFFRLTRRHALPRVLAGLEAAQAHPELRPIKVNAVALRGFTEDEVLPLRRLRAREALRGALHRVHAARRRPGVGRGQGPAQRRDPGDHRDRVRARAARPPAPRHGPPLRVRRRQGRDRLHLARSASRSAATATASGSRPRASCAPACSR